MGFGWSNSAMSRYLVAVHLPAFDKFTHISPGQATQPSMSILEILFHQLTSFLWLVHPTKKTTWANKKKR